MEKAISSTNGRLISNCMLHVTLRPGVSSRMAKGNLGSLQEWGWWETQDFGPQKWRVSLLLSVASKRVGVRHLCIMKTISSSVWSQDTNVLSIPTPLSTITSFGNAHLHLVLRLLRLSPTSRLCSLTNPGSIRWWWDLVHGYTFEYTLYIFIYFLNLFRKSSRVPNLFVATLLPRKRYWGSRSPPVTLLLNHEWKTTCSGVLSQN